MRRILLFSLNVSALLFVWSSTASAQCTIPCGSDYLPGQTFLTIMDGCGNPVNITVCYCYPDPSGPIFPREQIVITEIIFNYTVPPIPGCEIDKPIMRDIKRRTLLAHLQSTSACEGVTDCSPWCEQHPKCICPSAHAEWEMESGSCMKPTDIFDQNEQYVHTVYNNCGPGWCGSIYEVCCYDEAPSVRWLASDGLEGDCGSYPGCVLVCSEDTPNPEIGCKLNNGTTVSCCDDGSCPDPDTGECEELD